MPIAALVWWWHAPALVFLLPAIGCLALASRRRAGPTAGITASILLGLFVIEATLALLRPPGGGRLTEEQAETFFAAHAATELGPLPRAGRYPARRVTRDGEEIFDVVYTIGEDGLRVTPGQRDDGPERVNFFGCSFTFGQGLADDETMPFHLGHALDRETRNLGLMGWGPHQMLVMLESGRDTAGAVNVLMTAPWHAPRADCAPGWSGGHPRFRLTDTGALVRDGVCPDRQADPLRNTLRAFRLYLLADRVHAVLTRQATTDRQLRLYFAIVDRIAELSQERGQPFVVAYIGADELNGVELDNAAIKERLAASGATVVDVSLAASEAELSPVHYLHELDRHPSALANEERARLLAAVLAEVLEE